MAAEKWESTSTVPLKDSEGRMPVIGFGVYQIDRPDTAGACLRAITAGYRHIDTAQLYQNEAEVGEALKKCNLPREDIFVTTKIRYPRLGKGKTYLRALQSVKKMDPREDGYVDLFLIHTPYGINAKDRKEMWLALEKLHEVGKAKEIGVSNFAPEHLEEMRGAVSAHTIKLHPWTQQRETVEYCNEHGIILEAFSPLARGRRWDDAVVTEIAEKHAKSPAQILIRYCLQKGWVPLPKSENDERMKENLDVFGFDISEEEFKTTPKGDLNHPEKFGFEQGQVTPLQIATRDGVLLHAWHVLPHAVYVEHQENLFQRNTPSLDVQRTPSLRLLRDDPEARLVLHFHGSSGSVASSWRVDSYRALSSEASSKIHLLTFDYRGFGLSEGMPTEEGLIMDAESVFDWAVDVAGIPPERIVIFGHSMGSGVSIALTQKLMDRGIYTAGLVTVAGFVDMTTIARTYRFHGYPVFRPLQLVPGLVEFLTSKLSSTWRNADRLADIVGRSDRYHVEIVHAQDDAIVPCQNAVELFQRALAASRADTETNLKESNNSEEGIVRSIHTNKGTITLIIPQSGDHDKVVMGPALISAVLRTLHGTSS
ncbi:hypothetical protein SCAR479_10105 [Seiridium cardinale]|uniref:Uncharacterized protein n=1 Tax=Seiridium cardinale TaxID=138064 RepID=A0ABR2XHE6_9PEZI